MAARGRPGGGLGSAEAVAGVEEAIDLTHWSSEQIAFDPGQCRAITLIGAAPHAARGGSLALGIWP